MNNNKLYAIIIVSLSICAYIAIICGTYINMQGNTENRTEYVECGSCGAHVHDWWYVENINDGKSVEVCEFCYHNYMENTNTEN